MMSTDAMRAALEALEAVQQWTEKRPATHPWDAWQLVGPAIDKVRAALAQPVSAESAGWTDADSDAARLALELECLLSDKDVPMPALSRWWNSAHEALELHRARMRATPPASAERVPLTDEQIDALSYEQWGVGYPAFGRQQVRDFARAIERAHGIGEPAVMQRLL